MQLWIDLKKSIIVIFILYYVCNNIILIFYNEINIATLTSSSNHLNHFG
jgi:hypothetical protein